MEVFCRFTASIEFNVKHAHTHLHPHTLTHIYVSPAIKKSQIHTVAAQTRSVANEHGVWLLCTARLTPHSYTHTDESSA